VDEATGGLLPVKAFYAEQSVETPEIRTANREHKFQGVYILVSSEQCLPDGKTVRLSATIRNVIIE
jgi:hypothetical protein